MTPAEIAGVAAVVREVAEGIGLAFDAIEQLVAGVSSHPKLGPGPKAPERDAIDAETDARLAQLEHSKR